MHFTRTGDPESGCLRWSVFEAEINFTVICASHEQLTSGCTITAEVKSRHSRFPSITDTSWIPYALTPWIQPVAKRAKRIRNCVREMDTVARFGGDEFVVMLSEISADPGESTMHATNVAEKLRAALGEPYSLSVQTSPEAQTAVMHICSASIGVAMFDGSSNDSNELVRLADAAMYVAKDRGKNTVSFAK